MEGNSGLGQNQHQSLQLTITPQLQQSLRVLQSGLEELRVLVDKELAENPTLERSEPEDSPPTEIELNESELSLLDRPRTKVRSLQESGEESSRELPAGGESLTSYLLGQLGTKKYGASIMQLTTFLIGNLTGDGYLELSDRQIGDLSGAEGATIKSALGVLRSLEPAGVGARNLQDCLLLQLERAGKRNGLEYSIVKKHRDLLLQGKLNAIAQEEGQTVASVQAAIRELKKLNPFPGAEFSHNENTYIIPDVIVQELEGKMVAVTNDAELPQVHVSSYYKVILEHSASRQERRYIAERMRSASWLLQCIHQRQQTLRRVSQCIVEFEEDFIRDGVESLRPLHLKDVAAKVGLHESTVSRAITNKYLQTSRGIFEFKHFFTSRIQTGSGEVSSLLIKEAIRAMVQREAPDKPLSDYAIADALKDTNVKIARRTVTKYREGMGIPSAPERRVRAQLVGAH